MTSNIIRLSDYRNPGNGAREALQKWFVEEAGSITERADTDRLLAWLWAEGFKVVPVEGKKGQG